jgi:1-acyl-sn-glycerol-3-phosphate acyltransferase
MLYHVFTKTLGVLARIYFRAFTRGYKNVPSKGSVIIASNHLAVIDSFILPSIVWRKIWFIGKKEYFRSATFSQRFQKWFFTSVSVYPVDRAGGKAAEEALQVGRNAIESGNLFGIYPEGTRSPDGCLYKGRTGVARLALETRTPVVVVAMHGTRNAQMPGQVIPKPVRCGAIFGTPLTFEEYYDQFDAAFAAEDTTKVREILRAVTDQIMTALHALSGQTYVDIYASDAKDLLAQGISPIEHAKAQGLKVLPAMLPQTATGKIIRGARLQGPQL